MPIAFAARPLDSLDLPQARALAAAAGAHGVYLGNALSGAATAGDSGELLGFFGEDRLLGVAFFGERGNLIALVDPALDSDAVAGAIGGSRWPWRIVLGPSPLVQALARRERTAPLVHRTQVYYGIRPEEVAAGVVAPDARLATRRDQALLLEAALDLNEVDLRIDRRRVQRAWLKETIQRRLRRGQTIVVGPVGAIAAKLDIGSLGPCGLIVEGVYTFPHARGRGLARGLVATVARRTPHAPLVCLHVAADNEPALRAYAGAGMRALQECALLLRA